MMNIEMARRAFLARAISESSISVDKFRSKSALLKVFSLGERNDNTAPDAVVRHEMVHRCEPVIGNAVQCRVADATEVVPSGKR
jgi:hypothetical protein